MTEKEKLFAALTDAVKPIIAHIEASPKTTMGRYDQYILALDRVADTLGKNVGDKKRVYTFLANVFINAGANKRGVESALMVMGHM